MLVEKKKPTEIRRHKERQREGGGGGRGEAMRREAIENERFEMRGRGSHLGCLSCMINQHGGTGGELLLISA